MTRPSTRAWLWKTPPEYDTGSAAAINTALNGTTFTPTANYSGSTSVTVSTSDGSASDTDSIAINITPVADAPSLTIDVRGSTVSFTSSGETAANSDNTSEVVTTVPFEGWTRVNAPDNNPGGTNAVEVWTTGDTQQRQNGGNNIVVASIGNGDNFIELNDASSNVQTIGLSRTVSTQAGMVYELSLDYAGRPGFSADYTRIGVYVDGVLVGAMRRRTLAEGMAEFAAAQPGLLAPAGRATSPAGQ